MERRTTFAQYSKSVLGANEGAVLDFMFILKSIPPWMSIYSSAKNGYVHRIRATLKVKDAELHYEDFLKGLLSIVPKMLRKSLGYVFSNISLTFSVLNSLNYLQKRRSSEPLEREMHASVGNSLHCCRKMLTSFIDQI